MFCNFQKNITLGNYLDGPLILTKIDHNTLNFKEKWNFPIYKIKTLLSFSFEIDEHLIVKVRVFYFIKQKYINIYKRSEAILLIQTESYSFLLIYYF